MTERSKKPQRSPEDYIRRIRSLWRRRQLPEARACGEKALALFPKDNPLLAAHCETLLRLGDWKNALRLLKRLLDRRKSPANNHRVRLRMAGVYVDLGQPAEACKLLQGGLRKYPNSLRLSLALAKTRLLMGGLPPDPAPWRELAASPELAIATDRRRASVITACVAALRLAGHAAEARELLAAHFQPESPAWDQAAPDGFATLVVYNNSRTRVEFRAKLFDPSSRELLEPSRLVVTFDLMNQYWKSLPFGYRPLAPEDIDFLSVRKRNRSDFHQDFPRQAFIEVAAPIAAPYEDVVALGQSLGGYSALYYATWLPRCRVLATAPRNPQNPKYPSRDSNFDLFRHEYDMRVNEGATPTIAYDPRNAADGLYVKRCLKKSFPNALWRPYPYAGHTLVLYLLEIGIAKRCTVGFCQGLPFPEYDKKLRGNSAEYFRNLARVNFMAGRKERARKLLLRAAEIGHRPERTSDLMARMFPAEVEKQTEAPPKRPRSGWQRLRRWLARRLPGRRENR